VFYPNRKRNSFLSCCHVTFTYTYRVDEGCKGVCLLTDQQLSRAPEPKSAPSSTTPLASHFLLQSSMIHDGTQHHVSASAFMQRLRNNGKNKEKTNRDLQTITQIRAYRDVFYPNKSRKRVSCALAQLLPNFFGVVGQRNLMQQYSRGGPRYKLPFSPRFRISS